MRGDWLFLFGHVLHMDSRAVDRTRWADFVYYVDNLERWKQAQERPADE